MRVLRMSHCFTLVSSSPLHLPLVVVVACVLFVSCFPVFCKCLGGVLFIPPRVLDDRQCFTARSARQKKRAVSFEAEVLNSLLSGCNISPMFAPGSVRRVTTSHNPDKIQQTNQKDHLD